MPVATRSIDELLDAARNGDRAALARLLSFIERGGSDAREIGRRTHPLGGRAYTVGITGAPGSGKSTLTGRLITELRGAGEGVGVLAIDPTSPFSGGAILGDRVRMQDHALDDGVFIRSMATRGHLGGLALATPEAIRALDACGYPWVLLETVGVGQVEVEVAGEADTTVVVLNPGWGDGVQAAKAGLMEIADVFVINKADRPGVEETRRDLQAMLDLSGAGPEAWTPPIAAAVSTTGEGVLDVMDAIRAHRHHLEAGAGLAERRRARLSDELRSILVARLLERVKRVERGDAFGRARDAVAARDVDPWTAADDLLGDV
ncbi:MAG: methylmalonyl Co-A mutase-associated GTPase MeaB [Acidimicrobiales bacterium]